jgi:hypothetical protein
MALPRSVEESYYVSHALTSSGSESEWRQESTVDGVKVNFKPHAKFCRMSHWLSCPKHAAVFALDPFFAVIVHKMASYEC